MNIIQPHLGPDPRFDDREDRHQLYRTVLLPVALRAIDRGEWDKELGTRKSDPVKVHEIAEIIAGFAATDLVLSGKTVMLPMDEVLAAISAPPSEDQRSEIYSSLIGRAA